MTPRPLDVGIIGAGTAGCASALFLARAGHRVTIYERVQQPGPVGAGIVLQPSGMAALAALGLLGPVLARGAVLHELHCETPKRRAVVHLEYADLAPDLYGLGLHRGVLFQTLFDAARAEPGVTLRCGVGIDDLSRAPDGRNLVTDLETGRSHGPHDLVLIADGARTERRDDARLKKTVKKYPWGALWFVARDDAHAFHGRLHQIVNGTRRLYGLLPTGVGPSGDVPLVSLFWSIALKDVADFRRRGLPPWKEELRGYVPAAGPLLDQIESVDQLLLSEYHDVVMRPWHTEDVVYLGDAAHATSPQLGQGANLALVDAMVLADSIASATSLTAALNNYSAARRTHLGFYQLATRWLTPLFQSDTAWLGPIRDVVMPLLNRVPFFRRQMALAMCGISRGPLRRMMPLSSRPPALLGRD